jgi:hypothetical protein
MSQTELLDKLIPQDWDSKKPGTNHFQRVRWLQGVSDIVARPLNNRLTASTNATAVNCNGAVQSTGIGTGAQMPAKFAEFLVKARVTFNLSGAGTLYVYVVRTTGAIPANGAAPNGGDVAVAGDSFAGPATVGGQNMNGTLAFIDAGLNQATQYKYYFAVKGTNGLTANLVNNSQLMVSEF